MNIPQTGPSAQKAKFFSEVQAAFEFLAIFYSLPTEKQMEILQIIAKFKAEATK